MNEANLPWDEAAYPLRLFTGPLLIQVHLTEPLQAQASRRWFNALHSLALANHLRTVEVDGIIHVHGAGKGVRRSDGSVSPPGIMATQGRNLAMWIDQHEAVASMRLGRGSAFRGYPIVVGCQFG